jgi:endonuclease-3
MRLGFIPANATAEQAHGLLKPMIPPEHRYALHLLLIAHGRKVCRAVKPKCEECAIARFCAFNSARRAV